MLLAQLHDARAAVCETRDLLGVRQAGQRAVCYRIKSWQEHRRRELLVAQSSARRDWASGPESSTEAPGPETNRQTAARLLFVLDRGPCLLGQFGRHFVKAVRVARVLGDLPHDLFFRLAAGHEIAVRPNVPATHCL